MLSSELKAGPNQKSNVYFGNEVQDQGFTEVSPRAKERETEASRAQDARQEFVQEKRRTEASEIHNIRTRELCTKLRSYILRESEARMRGKTSENINETGYKKTGVARTKRYETGQRRNG